MANRQAQGVYLSSPKGRAQLEGMRDMYFLNPLSVTASELEQEPEALPNDIAVINVPLRLAELSEAMKLRLGKSLNPRASFEGLEMPIDPETGLSMRSSRFYGELCSPRAEGYQPDKSMKFSLLTWYPGQVFLDGRFTFAEPSTMLGVTIETILATAEHEAIFPQGPIGKTNYARPISASIPGLMAAAQQLLVPHATNARQLQGRVKVDYQDALLITLAMPNIDLPRERQLVYDENGMSVYQQGNTLETTVETKPGMNDLDALQKYVARDRFPTYEPMHELTEEVPDEAFSKNSDGRRIINLA